METIDIKLIKQYPNNPKEHPDEQIDMIVNSIREFGFNQSIVLDKNNEIIVGHGRYLAALKMGMTEVPFIRKENLTDEQVKAYRIADNKLNESGWNMPLVIDELKGLSDEMIELTGFDKDLIIEPDEKDDVIPEDAPPICQLGDLWQLGKHRLLCGDAVNESDANKLMGTSIAKMVFTSPPYNMAENMYEKYKDNLERGEYIKFNLDVINNFKIFIQGFFFWNISYNRNSRDDFIEILYRIIKETNLKFLELIVWNKKHALPITSREMLTRQYEDILLIGDQESIATDLELYFCGSNNKNAWFNKKTQKGITNYWEIGTNKTQLKNLLACFPVALPTKAILLMSNENDIVVDPFLGSGSTLIACEKTDRICYGMEIDPHYCDVIIKRWEDYTGEKAVKL